MEQDVAPDATYDAINSIVNRLCELDGLVNSSVPKEPNTDMWSGRALSERNRKETERMQLPTQDACYDGISIYSVGDLALYRKAISLEKQQFLDVGFGDDTELYDVKMSYIDWHMF